MEPLDEHDKADLRKILASSIYKRAVSQALTTLWKARKGAVTVEESALAHKYHEGACDVLECLHLLAEVKREFAPSAGKLRHDV
jgi:hypothetical protein